MRLARLLILGVVVTGITVGSTLAQEVTPALPTFALPPLPAIGVPSLELPSPDRFDLTVPSDDYLGTLSDNPYLADSLANPYRRYGSPYAPNGLNNPYSRAGSPYSPSSATNPYATSPPKIIGRDGTYLGRLSTNPYLPDSVTNPYGRYGSPYSPDSITNPYGVYGSPYSPYSPTNPYATSPPLIIDPR